MDRSFADHVARVQPLLPEHAREEKAGRTSAEFESRIMSHDQENYEQGVHVPRLMAAMSQMGLSCEPSQEAVAADLAVSINRLTSAITAKPAEKKFSDINSDLALLVARMARRLKKAGEGTGVHEAGHRDLADVATKYLRSNGLASPLREADETNGQPPLIDESKQVDHDPWWFASKEWIEADFKALNWPVYSGVSDSKDVIETRRQVVKTAPERIVLVVGPECPDDVEFKDLSEVSWCAQSVHSNDIWYQRMDLCRQGSKGVPGLRKRILEIGGGDFEVGVQKIISSATHERP